MKDRIAAMSVELQYHHTQPGPTCTCGYVFTPGEWITQHRAESLDVAIELRESGVALDNLHAAVVGALKLANYKETP